jgi:hypothetical protein
MRSSSRRDVLKLVGVGVAGAATVSLVSGRARAQGGLARSSEQTNQPSDQPSEEQQPTIKIAQGATFAGCTVVHVGHANNGAIPVTLESATGQRGGVDIMRHDPDVPGLARAGSLEVYVWNHGNGSLPTDEEIGLGAMALATHLATREARGEAMPELKTITERGARPGMLGMRPRESE